MGPSPSSCGASGRDPARFCRWLPLHKLAHAVQGCAGGSQRAQQQAWSCLRAQRRPSPHLLCSRIGCAVHVLSHPSTDARSQAPSHWTATADAVAELRAPGCEQRFVDERMRTQLCEAERFVPFNSSVTPLFGHLGATMQLEDHKETSMPGQSQSPPPETSPLPQPRPERCDHQQAGRSST